MNIIFMGVYVATKHDGHVMPIHSLTNAQEGWSVLDVEVRGERARVSLQGWLHAPSPGARA